MKLSKLKQKHQPVKVSHHQAVARIQQMGKEIADLHLQKQDLVEALHDKTEFIRVIRTDIETLRDANLRMSNELIEHKRIVRALKEVKLGDMEMGKTHDTNKPSLGSRETELTRYDHEAEDRDSAFESG